MIQTFLRDRALGGKYDKKEVQENQRDNDDRKAKKRYSFHDEALKSIQTVYSSKRSNTTCKYTLLKAKV